MGFIKDFTYLYDNGCVKAYPLSSLSLVVRVNVVVRGVIDVSR